MAEIYDTFAGYHFEGIMIVEQAASGSNFVGRALQADSQLADCIGLPLGVLSEEENVPPNPNTCYRASRLANGKQSHAKVRAMKLKRPREEREED
ncbi:uncharacterized protein UTRI_06407 [Ustilago trichophora]|uniref:Uncharacterized protein n=1 Tax=Ustilago trichophora TaxID=86804 RepID=A0A5C3EL65_9BASI|nr:uncharacterized protein UTRI_06407 [Ustilago trichophora]